MDIYLAVLEDSHIDIEIEPFYTFDEAMQKIIAWKRIYHDSLWVEEDNKKWEFYVEDYCEDGPNMRIEKKELR